MNYQTKQNLKPKYFCIFCMCFYAKVCFCRLLFTFIIIISDRFSIWCFSFFYVNFIMELVLLWGFSLWLERSEPCYILPFLACDSNDFTPWPAMEIVLKQTQYFAECLSPSTLLSQGFKSPIDKQTFWNEHLYFIILSLVSYHLKSNKYKLWFTQHNILTQVLLLT